jgi:HD-GYP domain-containing protein (c-di-GMP phosphodiesterase class II)
VSATVADDAAVQLLLALQRGLASGRGKAASAGAARKALEVALQRAHTAHGAVAIRLDPDDEVLFFNELPVLSRQHGRAISALLARLRHRGIAELRFSRPLTDAEVEAFTDIVQRSAAGLDPVSACRKVVEGLWETRLRGTVDVTSLEQYGHSARMVRVDPGVHTRLVYARLLTLQADSMEPGLDRELRRHIAWRMSKAILGLVDSARARERELLAFVEMRGVERFVVKHAVNTCILSVLLGHRLGLPRELLCQLGLAGTLCWSGKSRVPPAIVNKAPGARTPEEAKEYGRHPYRALGAVFELRRVEQPLLLGALCALQLESRPGCPPRRKPLAEVHPLAQIVALCDLFDGHMSSGPAPRPRHVVLEAVLGDKRRSFDPTLVQLFLGLVGGMSA